jgi:hypothetical protein
MRRPEHCPGTEDLCGICTERVGCRKSVERKVPGICEGEPGAFSAGQVCRTDREKIAVGAIGCGKPCPFGCRSGATWTDRNAHLSGPGAYVC